MEMNKEEFIKGLHTELSRRRCEKAKKQKYIQGLITAYQIDTHDKIARNHSSRKSRRGIIK